MKKCDSCEWDDCPELGFCRFERCKPKATIHIVIEMTDVELLGVRPYLDKEKAEADYEKTVEENQMTEESLEGEIGGTLRIAGDDVHAVQLIVREVE